MFRRPRLDVGSSHQAHWHAAMQVGLPRRHDQRVILHFDYDCFYAACVEVERPELRSLPLAVQQKQIIVTCNYEARRRGLYKLQLITEAKKACPDVIIILGEDLTRFRNHSKANYNFLKDEIWSGKSERLGFDEVWLDVTDMVDFNDSIINRAQLADSWFCLSKEDPTQGFAFDASKPAGGTLPKVDETIICGSSDDTLTMRLILGSHLAFYLREKLEEVKGFTSTVGISTNKLLSKLAGNVHKPRGQTTLLPPYSLNDPGDSEADVELSNVQRFLDDHEIGKIPGIGHKGAQQIRSLVKGHPVEYKDGLVTHYAAEKVNVRDVRSHPGIGPELLESTLGGPGAPRGIGGKVWELIHGVDDTEVSKARDVPRQISIEDTYLHLHDLKTVRQRLIQLCVSLVKRMRIDLTTEDELSEEEIENSDETFQDMNAIQHKHPGEIDDVSPKITNDSDAPVEGVVPTSREHLEATSLPLNTATSPIIIDQRTQSPSRRWLARPRTIRLSTRERKPKAQRSFARISRSTAMPSFVFSLEAPLEQLATKLAEETLLPLFTKLVPARSGFDVNLINVAATAMLGSAGENAGAEGRDIAKMFGNQDRVLRQWRVEDRDVPPDGEAVKAMGHDDSSLLEPHVDKDAIMQRGDDRLRKPSLGLPHPETNDIPVSPSREVQSLSQTPQAAIVPQSELPQIRPVPHGGSEDAIVPTQSTATDRHTDEDMETVAGWQSDEDETDGEADLAEPCEVCGALMPAFAREAHRRFHEDMDAG